MNQNHRRAFPHFQHICTPWARLDHTTDFGPCCGKGRAHGRAVSRNQARAECRHLPDTASDRLPLERCTVIAVYSSLKASIRRDRAPAFVRTGSKSHQTLPPSSIRKSRLSIKITRFYGKAVFFSSSPPSHSRTPQSPRSPSRWRRGECPRLLIDSYCATIVFQFAKRWTAMSARTKQTGRLSPEALGRTIAFINDRLADDISLDDLANLCGMTKFHFLRLFKASTNSSPYQYLRDRRIERARHLLSTTQYAIGDIAGQCGFASATGFAEMFRKVVGVAPTAWRAAQKK